MDGDTCSSNGLRVLGGSEGYTEIATARILSFLSSSYEGRGRMVKKPLAQSSGRDRPIISPLDHNHFHPGLQRSFFEPLSW